MIPDPKYLVHHGLVRPLVEEGRDRIVPSVQDQENRRCVTLEIKEVSLARDRPMKLLGQTFGHVGTGSVPGGGGERGRKGGGERGRKGGREGGRQGRREGRREGGRGEGGGVESGRVRV